MQTNHERWPLIDDNELLPARPIQGRSRVGEAERRSLPLSRPSLSKPTASKSGLLNGWLAWLEPPSEFSSALGDGVAWIAGAIALRLAVEFALAHSDGAWFPSVLLLTSPALVAVTLATLMPRHSWLFGYRLVLIMFGLLIGGRL